MRRSGKDRWGALLWDCQCECGKTYTVLGCSLKNGNTRSCGCLNVESARKRKAFHDVSGQKFGRLTAISESGRNISGVITWHCHCECGNDSHVSIHALMSGHTRSCGCLAKIKPIKDITGQRFGHLVAVKLSHMADNFDGAVWECRCDCGRSTSVTNGSLASGNTQSCGCLSKTEYRGRRFHSRWEIFYYIASLVRGDKLEYEPEKLTIIVDGKKRKYTPDFRISGTRQFIEIKGWQREYSMTKWERANEQGFDVRLVTKQGVEEYCCCPEKRLQKAYANGGMAAVESMIANGIFMDRMAIAQ